jgi:hypothetical protein
MNSETRGVAPGWSASALSAPEVADLDEPLENQNLRFHPRSGFMRWLLVTGENLRLSLMFDNPSHFRSLSKHAYLTRVTSGIIGSGDFWTL